MFAKLLGPRVPLCRALRPDAHAPGPKVVRHAVRDRARVHPAVQRVDPRRVVLHERLALSGPRDEMTELADTVDGCTRLTYDADAAWRAAISRLIHEPGNDVRQAVRQWVEWVGPQGSAPDRCQWLPGGFERYVNSLILP